MSSPGPEAISISVNTKENVWRVPQHGDNMTHHEGNIKILRVRIVSGTIPRQSFFTETYYMRISLKENRQATEIHTEKESIKQTGNNPNWDEEFLFRVDPRKEYILRFEVFKACTVYTYLEIPLNHTSIDIERPGRDVASKEYTLTPKGQLQLYLAYVGNEEEIETSNENPSAPQEGRGDTYDDKDDAIDNKFEDWDPNTQYLMDTNDDGKEELTIDFEEEVIDDEEIHKDVLDKSVLECLNPEPILDRLQANADIPYTDVRDIRDEECAETRQKHLFQNVCDEETTEDKEEISDSLNEKEDDKQETRKDTEKSHTRVLNRSISTIKESMNPEPILDSLIQDEVFQNTVIRDIMEQTTTTKKNEAIIEKVRQNGTDVYKLFKKYLGKSQQYLLLKFIENTERGEETTDIQNELKEQTRRRLKEIRHQKSIEETSVNLVEEQLVISIQNGKKFEGTQDIEEKLGIYTSSKPSSEECCNVVKCIFEGSMEKYSDQLIKAVKDISSIMNVEVKAASVDKDNTVVMTMACASCKEIRMLLQTLKGNEFKSKIENLKTALCKEYEIVCVIHAKVSHEKIKEVQQHLMEQGVINETHADDLFCENHPQQQAELFCPEHDKFVCHKCEEKHRMCQGVRQRTKDVSTKIYRIRSDEPAHILCTTMKLCTLPSGEILLIDNVNNKLKKLDLTYNVVGQYTFDQLEKTFDICAINATKAFVAFGNQVCVVSVGDIDIQVEKFFKTKAPCFRLYSKDSAIYYTDNLSIYTCDENGDNNKNLHKFRQETLCYALVVSDDRSKIVVAAGVVGLIIIDANNQNRSTVTLQELQGCTDLCIVNNQMLLVCASNTLYLVDIELGKVLKQAAIGLRCPRSFAFDVIDNSVIGGNLGNDFISVFNANIEYDAT
ncbi:uncharacterized protein LOC132719417 [Ruditapes philippinarum]|uniref:uncharacterized protein LOC132719417 n=1 Tax=Ruditapes philippinarum TaxID=129788 RepID=UPI00295A6E21|nr:uncharacterized protein LOC132719417 [Ruditapes philippinarum]